MGVAEPRVRRRGFFLHVETPDLDAAEQDSAEGIAVRVRVARSPVERASLTPGRQAVTSSVRSTSLVVQPADSESGSIHHSNRTPNSPRNGAIGKSGLAKHSFVRSANGTGSHRLARMHR